MIDRREMLAGMVAVVGGQSSANAPSYTRARKPVVPQQVIDEYRLSPVEGVGFGIWVMGEDGKPYSLDDVLFIMFTIMRVHWGGDENPAQQRPQAKAKRPY